MKTITYTIAFLLLSGAVWAQPAGSSYTLQQALDYAAQNSPLVKNAQVDIEIYKQKVKEVTAIGLPQINATGAFSDYLNIPTTVVPANAFNPAASPNALIPVRFGTTYQTSAGVTASQLIFDGSYFVGLKATKELRALQLQLEQKSEVDVKNEVVKAYYMAVIADENIKTLNATLQNLDKLKNETQAIYKEGLVEQQDAEQLELTVEGMRNNISRAENMRKISYNLLKLNMGLDVNSEMTLADSVGSLNSMFVASDYQGKEFAISQLPEYKIVQTQIHLNELSLKNEKAKYYPTLGAFVTHSYNLPSNKMDQFDHRRWFPTSIFGLNLNVPIFSSGMRHARVQQAQLTLQKSVNTMQQTENGLKMAAESAKLNFNFAMENLNTMKKSMELADRIQQKTLVKYKEGVATSLELNQAQTQYLSAQANYINGLYTVLSSKAEMDKAFGLIQTTNTTK